MIRKYDDGFLLGNDSYSLVLRIGSNGKLTCEHFGKPLGELKDLSSLKHDVGTGYGNKTVYDEKNDPTLTLDDIFSEFSTPYKGDYNDPSLIMTSSKGNVFDFKYVSFELKKPEKIKGLPTPIEGEDELVLLFKDEAMGVSIKLHYITFLNNATVARYVEIINDDSEDLLIKKAASLQLILPDKGYDLVTYYGAWPDEFKENITPITHLRQVIESVTGSSSNRHNPFFYIKKKDANWNDGECYSFNLIYSGNFFAEVELSTWGNIRIQNGIAPLGFEVPLKKGESFITPVAIESYSDKGINGLSKINHDFVNHHIIPKQFQGVDKCIDYNSWEGSGMDFNEAKIKKLMKKASSLGMELFVLDDGWFGSRNTDQSGLGDWEVNKKKLKHGIKGITAYCHKLGMKFGIWVEPEMVNPDSNLYRLHPDWAVKDGIHEPSLSRHQLNLDLSKKEVREYIIEAMSKIFSEDVDFIKWDYNRNISDIPNKKGYCHQYILGLYEIMEELTSRFPNVMVQNCASGGNRCDLGMFSYFPLTWVSDDTDCHKRAIIQENMAVGYPLSVMSNHVSSKTNCQTLRKTSLAAKFGPACLGVFGYELNLLDINKQDEAEIKRQIEFYKKFKHVLQYGEYHQFRSLSHGNESVRCVSLDGRCVSVKTIRIQELSLGAEYLEMHGLDEDKQYRYFMKDEKLDLSRFGPHVNSVSPIHVKEDSFLLHLLSKFKQMDTEKFEGEASGKFILSGGVELPAQWHATGYNEKVAYLGDFGSRIYAAEPIEK